MIFKIFNRKLYCALLSSLISVSCIHAMENKSFDSQCVNKNENTIAGQMRKLMKDIRENKKNIYSMLKKIGFIVSEEEGGKIKEYFINDLSVFPKVMSWAYENLEFSGLPWYISELDFTCADYFLATKPFSTSEELSDFCNVLNCVSAGLKAMSESRSFKGTTTNKNNASDSNKSKNKTKPIIDKMSPVDATNKACKKNKLTIHDYKVFNTQKLDRFRNGIETELSSDEYIDNTFDDVPYEEQLEN